MKSISIHHRLLLTAILLLCSLHSSLATPVPQDLKALWEQLQREADMPVDSKGELPVGLAKRINGTTIVVALDSLRMTRQGPTFGAFVSLEDFFNENSQKKVEIGLFQQNTTKDEVRVALIFS